MKRTIISILVLLVGNWALHTYYIKLASAKSRLLLKQSDFAANGTQSKLLFMGDSHMERAIDPRLLTHAYNLASSGENYIQNYYNLKNALKTCKPDTIVINRDVQSFSSFSIDNFEEDYFWTRHINYLKLAVDRQNIDLISKWLTGNFCAYFGNYANFYYLFAERNSPPSVLHKGFAPDNSIFDSKNDDTKARVAYHIKDKELETPILIAHFEAIMALCAQENIKVKVIQMPLSIAYLSHIPAFANKATLDQDIETICQKYTNIIEVSDYTHIFDLHQEYFMDSDHLNEKGAQAFTQILKN